jgi:transcription elongation factor GreA
MAGADVLLTKEGFTALTAELQRLKSEDRPRVIQEIADARAHGDLSENAEYSAAREKQGFIEGRIADLDDKLSRAQVIDFSKESSDQVRFGAWVTVLDDESGEEKTLRIVGDLEADIKLNKISISSPIAKAMLGKRVDDTVEFNAPKGLVTYTITAVKY